MPLETDFRPAYEDLVSRMRALADTDGAVLVPNPEPSGPVEYVFICMEPSVGGWARDAEDANAKVADGFRNFVFLDPGTLALHFAIRQYLCEPHERYHLTDMSKGAMPVQRASDKVQRWERWKRWYSLLLEELNLVAKAQAHIFAVGRDVDSFLLDQAFPRGLHKPVADRTVLLHYSPSGKTHRKRALVDHEAEFEEFKTSLSYDQVLTTAKEVMAESLPPPFQKAALARLTPLRLHESDLQLMFTYKLAFRSALVSRTSGDVG